MFSTKDEDFLAFDRVIEETLRTCRMRVCACCLLSNHWHFVLWPERDGDLSAFMQHMTNMHVRRWKQHRRETGYGHPYQGRYKCLPVQAEEYFHQVVCYVARARCGQSWSSLRRQRPLPRSLRQPFSLLPWQWAGGMVVLWPHRPVGRDPDRPVL